MISETENPELREIESTKSGFDYLNWMCISNKSPVEHIDSRQAVLLRGLLNSRVSILELFEPRVVCQFLFCCKEIEMGL
jgi:hypothetical protein